jgi:hypothetical protein
VDRHRRLTNPDHKTGDADRRLAWAKPPLPPPHEPTGDAQRRLAGRDGDLHRWRNPLAEPRPPLGPNDAERRLARQAGPRRVNRSRQPTDSHGHEDLRDERQLARETATATAAPTKTAARPTTPSGGSHAKPALRRVNRSRQPTDSHGHEDLRDERQLARETATATAAPTKTAARPTTPSGGSHAKPGPRRVNRSRQPTDSHGHKDLPRERPLARETATATAAPTKTAARPTTPSGGSHAKPGLLPPGLPQPPPNPRGHKTRCRAPPATDTQTPAVTAALTTTAAQPMTPGGGSRKRRGLHRLCGPPRPPDRPTP